jgi:hypothetical protein
MILLDFLKDLVVCAVRQIDQIRASIEAFGFTNPVLTDPEGNIIAGHGRLQAARLMGLAERWRRGPRNSGCDRGDHGTIQYTRGHQRDPYRETARMALEPWLVEAALARLDRRLNAADQRTIVKATRTPHRVRWPNWWTEHP